jgi:proteic killer suppression protein
MPLYSVVEYIPDAAANAEEASMIQSFRDAATADVFNDIRSQVARRACPLWLWAVARRKLAQLNSAVTLKSLAIPPGNRLEALKGNRRGQHSIRINERYRICFIWVDVGPVGVEITDYH